MCFHRSEYTTSQITSLENALGNRVPMAGIEKLVQLLGDSDSHVRTSAALALEQLGNRVPVAGIEKLFQMLKVANGNERDDIGKVLIQLGKLAPTVEIEKQNESIPKPDIEQLIQDLDFSKNWIKATEALAERGERIPDTGVEKLIQMTEKYPQSHVTRALVQTPHHFSQSQIVRITRLYRKPALTLSVKSLELIQYLTDWPVLLLAMLIQTSIIWPHVIVLPNQLSVFASWTSWWQVFLLLLGYVAFYAVTHIQRHDINYFRILGRQNNMYDLLSSILRRQLRDTQAKTWPNE